MSDEKRINDLNGKKIMPHQFNLINIPDHKKDKKEGWVNIYSHKTCGGAIHATKNDANRFAISNRVACVRIEWEE